MTELTEYAPIAKTKHATYLAAVLSVAAATAKPAMAIPRPAVMCHVRSWNLPELQPKAIPAAPAKMKGGHVRTSVMVVSKPRVLITLLKYAFSNGEKLKLAKGKDKLTLGRKS